MNNDELMTAMRDRFAAVRMETPAETIMARGASMRHRRSRGRLAAGALAISLGAGLSVPALTAGTDTAAAAHPATLAAWTVQTHPDGSISVTIRRPQNLAALKLRLARLGAAVEFSPAGTVGATRACKLRSVPLRAVKFEKLPHGAVALEIHPAKIPLHALLWISLPARPATLEVGHVPPGATVARLVLACNQLPLTPLKPVEIHHS